ncbi:Spt20 family-domain-containing protein [Chiua virens]|nr:Spt20 family-domain-containing protein [Chiua virens]
MTGYNITRSAEELLEKYDSEPPSFSIHLYPEYWTLNNGPKFLYNNPVASLLDDIRAHRIPVDYLELFDSVHVPFYDGRMLVELLDYRPKKAKDPPLEKPERSRVTLHPNDETLWADLCLMNQRFGSKLTDPQVLEVEAQILLHTSPPLCLDPDPHLTRIVNHTLRVSTPSIPVSLKRKIAAITQEEDESEKARRAKIIQFMNPRLNRSHVPSYSILDVMKRLREIRQAETQAMLAKVIANPPNRSTPAPTTQSTTAQPSHTAPAQASTPVPQPPTNASKPRQIKKEPAGSPYPNTPENPRSTATPAPHPVVNQLQSQPPMRSPPVHTRSPAPPNPTYQQHSVGTPIAVSSPAQRGYTQSPRPPSSQGPHPHSSPLPSGSQPPPSDPRANPGGVHFIQMASGSAQSKPSTPQLNHSTQVPPPPQQATAQTQPHPQPTPQPAAPSPQAQTPHPTINMQQYYAAQLQQLQRMSQVAQAHAQAHAQAQAQAQTQAQSQLPTQMSQPAQHPAIPTQYNFSQYRPVPAQGNPHTQVVAHLSQNQQQNIGTQGQVLDSQQQMMAQYAMYPYPVPYGMAAGGRLPAQYAAWAANGMGRLPNGQAPGMQPGHPQMPVAQGKAAQAGVQGR